MRDNQDPYIQEEQKVYRTGPTKLKKSHGGLIAVLLVLVIFLGGIASAMGVLNIKLFRQLSSHQEATSLHFSQSEDDRGLQQKEDAKNPPVSSQIQISLEETPQAADNMPQGGGLPLQDIYEKAIPSVISISCQTASGTATGTGVILSADGYLLTNCHVVENAYAITILFQDGRQLDAQLVGVDGVSDLAVLYVEAEDLSPAEFGNSDSLRVGDAVVAIGDPLGLELRGTMTDGIVSAINRDITTAGRTMTLIQTNAALNSGNSGGPLLNCYGQIIGINTMKIGDFMNEAGVEGLGFAIPSSTVKEIVDQLLSQGFVAGRPSLGITAETVSTFLQMYYNLPQGVYITYVEPESCAEQLGIEAGDILLSMDDVRITDTDVLATCLYSHTAGDQVDIIIYRAGQQYSAVLTLDQATN